MAGRILERCEPDQPEARLLDSGTAPARRSQRRRRADDAADQQRPQPLAPGRIVSHAPSVDTWRRGAAARNPGAAAPRLARRRPRPRPGCDHAAVRICTLGDLLLDVIVRLDRPFTRGDDAPATIRTRPGGQAVNVAAWAAALGAEARFIGKRGDDEGGSLVAARLAELGVEVRGPVSAGASTGMVVSVVEPGGERTLLSDRGVSPELAPGEIDPAWLQGCARLHISGYSLLRLPHFDAALAAAAQARAGGAIVSVDLSSAALIRDFGVAAFLERLDRLAPDIVLGNELEHAAIGAPHAPTWALKRGPRGCLVGGPGGETVELPALPADVLDTTGAGDAFAAGFLLGGTLREMAERGLAAAARCVATLGSMPA